MGACSSSDSGDTAGGKGSKGGKGGKKGRKEGGAKPKGAKGTKERRDDNGFSNPLSLHTLEDSRSKRMTSDEASARRQVEQAEQRQRDMTKHDFERNLPRRHNEFDFGVPTTDEDDDFDEGAGSRRCSMRQNEHDAAKRVGSTARGSSAAAAASMARNAPPLSPPGVRRHDQEGDCWVIIREEVYNVSELLDSHPGGSYAIFQHGGTDATRAFLDAHPVPPMDALRKYRLGPVQPA